MTETAEKIQRYDNSRFDHVKFSSDLDAIRKFKRLETQGELADAIGIHYSVLGRLKAGEGIGFEQLCKIVLWSNLDLRDYLSENG